MVRQVHEDDDNIVLIYSPAFQNLDSWLSGPIRKRIRTAYQLS